MSHIGFAERVAIEAGICRQESLTAIAKDINVQPRAVSEEIRRNRTLLPAARYNGKDCRFADECRRRFVCGKTDCLRDCVICDSHIIRSITMEIFLGKTAILPIFIPAHAKSTPILVCFFCP